MELILLKKTSLALAAAGLFAAGAVSGFAAPQLLTAPVALESRAAIPLGSAPNYRAIVAQNRDAVVGITTDGETESTVREFHSGPGDPHDNTPFNNTPFGDNDPFFQFFGQLPLPNGNMLVHGQGSGFILGSNGTILTNAHVVRDAKRVTVRLADRREFDAKVLGVDPATDIAVLKIDAHDLPTVRLGDSAHLGVGDYVLAIGAPFGLEESATAGIVSAKGRSLPSDSAVQFIQTDVAVNPGNSGGPLFDASGAVVGINAQIYSSNGGSQGVSFAIPIDLALRVKDQIVAHGKVEHARLGVMVQALTAPLAKSFGLDSPSGALVSKIEPGSAAANAGLKTGDVILKLNDEPIMDSGELAARVGTMAPGDKVQLEVWRDGKPSKLDAKLDATMTLASNDSGSNSGEHGRVGLAVRPLTPDERDQAGVSGGLLVQDSSGPAAEAGIRSGDIVLSVDGSPVQSDNEMRSLVHKHEHQVALLIQRGESRIFIPVAMG